MAVSVVLAGTSSLTLSAAPYGILEPASLGTPALREVYAEQWGRGHHPIIGDSYGNREIALSLLITGTSADNWAQNYRAIAQVLRGTRQYYETAGARGTAATLTVQLNGATNATTYDVLSGSLPDMAVLQSSFGVTTPPYVRGVPLRMVCKPFGRLATLQTSSGVVNIGTGTLTVSAPLGDHEAPARLTITPFTAPMTRLIAGRRSRGTVANIVWPLGVQLDNVYTGYDVVAAMTTATGTAGAFFVTTATSTGRGTNTSSLYVVAKNNAPDTATGVITWKLNSNTSDWFGSWRAYLQVSRMAINAGAPRIKDLWLSYGGSSGDLLTLPHVAMSTAYPSFGVFDMGVLSFPAVAAPQNQAVESHNIQLHMGSLSAVTASAGGEVEQLVIDGLYLLPIDEQVVDIALQAAVASSGDRFVFDGLAAAPEHYQLNSSAEVQDDLKSFYAAPLQPTVQPGINNRWFPLMATGSISTGAHFLITTASAEMKVEYYPLYEGFSS